MMLKSLCGAWLSSLFIFSAVMAGGGGGRAVGGRAVGGRAVGGRGSYRSKGVLGPCMHHGSRCPPLLSGFPVLLGVEVLLEWPGHFYPSLIP